MSVEVEKNRKTNLWIVMDAFSEKLRLSIFIKMKEKTIHYVYPKCILNIVLHATLDHLQEAMSLKSPLSFRLPTVAIRKGSVNIWPFDAANLHTLGL